MFSEELSKLIEASLVDGVITDQERAVIRKRALLEGVDPDEVDVMLDAEVQKIRKKQEEAVTKVKKCPSCGEIIPAMTAVCPSCGHVVDARNDSDLNQYMEKLEGALVKLKEGGAVSYNNKVRTELESMIRQGKALYGDNKKVAYLITEIESSINKFDKRHKNLVRTFIFIIVAIVVVSLSIYVTRSKNEQKLIEACITAGTQQCDSLCSLIDKLPSPNADNYKEVEHQLLSITWKKINCPDSDTDEKVNGDKICMRVSPEGIIAPYIKKKRAYASQIYAIYKELFPGKNRDSHWDGLEASLHAPEEIYDTNEITN